MNQELFPNVTVQHPLFKQWAQDRLPYDTYSFTNDLQMVVHQTLTATTLNPTDYQGTILDLKHRKGKTQKMYRLKNEGERVICIIYDSERPFPDTIIELPELNILDLVCHLLKNVLK